VAASTYLGLRYSWASIATGGGSAHSPSKSVSAGEVVCVVSVECWVGNSGEKDPGLCGPCYRTLCDCCSLWWRGVGFVGLGDGRGLAGRHLWISVIGAMRFGDEGVWVVCSGFVKVGSNILQARRVRGEIGAQTGDEYDGLFKVVLIGDSGVGKSDPRVTNFP
jgi:hypothetical protein